MYKYEMRVDLGGVSGGFGREMRRSGSFVGCWSLCWADWSCFGVDFRQFLVDLRMCF